MKLKSIATSLVIVAALLLLTLAIPTKSVAQGKKKGKYTSFARQSTIQDVDGELHGNWQGSFDAACQVPKSGDPYIEKGTIKDMTTDEVCPGTEDHVVKVVHN